ncbi:uncharacterized protein LOC110644506 isoform X2 [Hevea brasiliensis]|uniref:uncharacterized protein LOC110644506 isoform X2 n=1 Tax=Hevea brasiliensis TaxID=3981 RepID=UPI0025DEE897|nr:uncharacterized protein LOC110644506 isoform X2 [Hevea brasiliensis]
MMLDADDDGFGDFKFAPFDHTVRSNPILMNGRDSAAATNDDEDWGDFVNSGGLSHALSLPKISKPLDPFGFSTDQKVKNNDSEPNQPGSAPGRVNSGMAQWEKPKGALPLSIFGELEEDEESGAGDPSFGDGGASFFSRKNVDSVKKGSGLNVNDLVANLYKQSDHKIEYLLDLKGSNSVDKTNKNAKNSDLNISFLNLGAVEPNSNARSSDSSANWIYSNANDLNENGNDELKLNSQLLNLDWDTLNLNTNVRNSNKDEANSVTKEAKSSANGANSVPVADNGKFDDGDGDGDGDGDDDDDGWEFKDSQPKTHEISKANQIKTKNEPAPNINGFNLNLNELSLDLNGWDMNVNGVNSSATSINMGLVDENREVDDGDEDGWEFKDAQPKTSMGDEISEANQIKTENGPVSNLNGFNSSWNKLSWDFNGLNSNFSSVNSSINSMNPGLVGEISEVFDDGDGDNDGWEFKGADSKPQAGDEKIKTEPMPTLNFNRTSLSWDVLSSDSSGLNPSDVKLDGKQFIANLIDGKKDSSDADGWAFKGAEPELQFRDFKMRTENGPAVNSNVTNSSWNTLSLDEGSNSKLNGVNLDKKQVNLDLFDENYDLGCNDGWEFKTVESGSRLGDENTKGDGRMQENFNGALYTFGFGNGVHGQSNFGFDFYSSYKKMENDMKDKLHYPQVDAKVGSDENSWAFKDAFSEAGSKDKEEPKVAEVSLAVEALVFDDDVQGNKVRADNLKGALPLSLFGDEETEADDPVIHQDISTQKSTSDQRVGIKSPHFNISINDLISNLYSQAEQSHLVNHEQSLSENELDFTKTVMSSNLTNANHDFDDDSWEFQDASTGARAEDQTSVHGLHECHAKYSTKIELNDYVEFFSKLKDELHYVALCHLENLKKTQSDAALNGEDAKVQAFDKEIQDLDNELHQDSIFSCEVHSESRSPGNICLNMFVEVLQEPEFQGFESDCHLTKKLSLAESDLRSALALLKYVALTLKILTSVPREEQSRHISAWSKMLSVCAQELRHGAFIWKQSLKENVHDQILSKPQGKKYVLALGEIYRVVEVLQSSATLYKPWILASSTDPMGIFTLLSECSSLWSSSGLEEALHGILNSPDFEYHESLKTLLESIKYIHDLDSYTLYNHVVSGQGRICQLSGLTTGIVPGMKTVIWNGEHCFLTLANLWANLVSSEPPNLPCINVG